MMELLLFVAAALRISVPYALAAVGASFSERGGVINIALEGLMLIGALAYTLGAHWSGSPWLGVLSSLVAGLLEHETLNETDAYAAAGLPRKSWGDS